METRLKLLASTTTSYSRVVLIVSSVGDTNGKMQPKNNCACRGVKSAYYYTTFNLNRYDS